MPFLARRLWFLFCALRLTHAETTGRGQGFLYTLVQVALSMTPCVHPVMGDSPYCAAGRSAAAPMVRGGVTHRSCDPLLMNGTCIHAVYELQLFPEDGWCGRCSSLALLHPQGGDMLPHVFTCQVLGEKVCRVLFSRHLRELESFGSDVLLDPQQVDFQVSKLSQPGPRGDPYCSG